MRIQARRFCDLRIMHKEHLTPYTEISIRSCWQFIYGGEKFVNHGLIRYTKFCIWQFVFKISAGYYMRLFIFFPGEETNIHGVYNLFCRTLSKEQTKKRYKSYLFHNNHGDVLSIWSFLLFMVFSLYLIGLKGKYSLRYRQIIVWKDC